MIAMENLAAHLPLPTQLLPCLAIPFVELFPNLCLGWWTPPSLNLPQYKKLWYLRISLLSIAMFPVFELLLPIIDDGPNFSLLVLGFAFAVGARSFLVGKHIERVFATPMWNTELPPDKRRALYIILAQAQPSDVDKFDELTARYVAFPTKVAGMVCYGVLAALHVHLDADDQLRVLGAFGALVAGGIGLGGTRHASIALDVVFRGVFAAGFVGLLHYVSAVSDAVLVQGLR